MKPTHAEALLVIRAGLAQMPTAALLIAKQDITDHPEKILMDGQVYLKGRY